MRRPVVGLVILAGLLLTGVAGASAHALLVRSIPESNAILPQSPRGVDLYFSEGLEAAFSTASVLDDTGQTVDSRDAVVDPTDPTHVSLTMRPLPDGVYTVTWRALSTSDGHVTTGSFPFAVGRSNSAQLAAADSANQQADVSAADVVLGWCTYLAVLTLGGGALFRLAVWPRSISEGKHLPEIEPAAWGRLMRLACVLLISSMGAQLLVQGGKVTGTLLAAPWGDTLRTLLFTSRFGGLWGARLLLSVGLVALSWRTPGPRELALSLPLAALYLLTLSLGSHAAAEARPFVPVLADWAHLMAAAAWLGGLAHFAMGLWSMRQLNQADQTNLAAVLMPRFTMVALPSVAIIAASGVYAAYLRLGSIDALVGSLYGRVLAGKIGIALLMIGLGAVNLLLTAPRMRGAAAAAGGQPGLVDRFGRRVVGETSLGIIVLLFAGILTAAPPAQAANRAPAFQEAARAEDLDLDIRIEPGKVGLNTFTVTVRSNGAGLVNDANQVQLKFTPDSDLPPSTLDLDAAGQGQYRAQGGNLSQPSNWQIQTVIRREGAFDAYANFTLDLQRQAAVSSPGWGRWVGAFLLLAGVAMLFVTSRVEAWRRGGWVARALPALALGLTGAWAFVKPPLAPQAGPANPIPPNRESVVMGEALYRANCAACHGQTGKGDGPMGLTLNPPPADLTYHGLPGVHPDGQLYGWISTGYPGSAMPAFESRLTDIERWHLVNYLRALAQGVQ